MSESEVRQRGTKFIETVKSLDVYTELNDNYKEKTEVGGALSLIGRILIVFLIYKEVSYYQDANLTFKFQPDTDLDKKLEIHMDVTIKMPCRSVGADIVDSTNQNVFSFGSLEEEDTWWDLCPIQRGYFEAIQHTKNFIREEYHSIADLIFKDVLFSGGSSITDDMPKRSDKPNRPYDACRIHGTLTLNKVAGNFHITAGKSLHLPQGHIHISSLFDDTAQNFSHRVNKFSFGPLSSRLIQPLEGDERIFHDSSTMAQYFIEVVPTEIHGLMSKINAYQYSVKENMRPINHNKGSHGIPGLYFKYDMSALKVIVRQDRDNFIQFNIRLWSIVAGIYTILRIVHSFSHHVMDKIVSKKAILETHVTMMKTIDEVVPVLPNRKPNELITNANRMVESSVTLTTVNPKN